jgi:polysaccharide biosynthesis/export protein
MHFRIYFILGIFCGGLSACGDLPLSGPAQRDIVSGATTTMVNPPYTVAFEYALVDINQLVVANAVDIDAGSFHRSFGTVKTRAPELHVGVGDVLQVTVFESKSGGLFIPADSGTRPGNYVTLPPQVVDHHGVISVPYAGEIEAAGLSITQIQAEIEGRLANRAIEPKVVVALTEQNATTVSVVGDVNNPRKMKIPQNGARILDAIADAGGIKYAGYDTFVTLQRKARKSTIWFGTLIRHPEENIYVVPGDTIFVYKEARRFVAFGALNSFGALGATGQFNFDQEHLTLAEAVGRAGGLTDTQANPGQVFIYRLETRKILTAMGVDLSRFPPEQEVIPTVYRANFRDPSSYFYAQQFPMRGRDILYATNADSYETYKFLTYVTAWTGTAAAVAQDGALTRQGIRYLATGKAPAL